MPGQKNKDVSREGLRNLENPSEEQKRWQSIKQRMLEHLKDKGYKVDGKLSESAWCEVLEKEFYVKPFLSQEDRYALLKKFGEQELKTISDYTRTVRYDLFRRTETSTIGTISQGPNPYATPDSVVRRRIQERWNELEKILGMWDTVAAIGGAFVAGVTRGRGRLSDRSARAKDGKPEPIERFVPLDKSNKDFLVLPDGKPPIDRSIDAIEEGAKKVSGRVARADTAQDLSEALTRERLARISRKDVRSINPEQGSSKGLSREVRDTAQDMGDTFDLSKFEGKMSAKKSPQSGRLPTTEALRARDVYSEGDIKILGENVAEKAAKIGIDAEHLGKEIWLAEYKAMMKTNRQAALHWERLGRWTPENFYPVARGAAREGVRRDIEKTYSLGEGMAKGLIDYGHHPHDISRRIDELAAKGLTANEIRKEFANDLKLMNYYRDKFCGGSLERAREGLVPKHVPEAGDVEVAISTGIWKEFGNKYKRALDVKYGRAGVWTELPDEMQSKILADLSEKADEITKRLVKRLLGSTSAVLPFGAREKDRSIEDEAKEVTQKIKIRDIDRKKTVTVPTKEPGET